MAEKMSTRVLVVVETVVYQRHDLRVGRQARTRAHSQIRVVRRHNDRRRPLATHQGRTKAVELIVTIYYDMRPEGLNGRSSVEQQLGIGRIRTSWSS